MTDYASLERLARLRSEGHLSEEEFASAKAEVLRGDDASQTASPTVTRDARAHMEYDAGKKSVMVAYLLWFFFGLLSVHRFYARKWFTGLLQIVIGVVGLVAFLPSLAADMSSQTTGFDTALSIAGVLPFVWIAWLVLDAIFIPGWVRRYNQRLAKGI